MSRPPLPGPGSPRQGKPTNTPFSLFGLQPEPGPRLIGAFANANQTGFHRKDGAGYAFFVEIRTLAGSNARTRNWTARGAWRPRCGLLALRLEPED